MGAVIYLAQNPIFVKRMRHRLRRRLWDLGRAIKLLNENEQGSLHDDDLCVCVMCCAANVFKLRLEEYHETGKHVHAAMKEGHWPTDFRFPEFLHDTRLELEEFRRVSGGR